MILLGLVLLCIKTLHSFRNLDCLASLGRFNGTWIEHLEIKMFIATGIHQLKPGQAHASSQFKRL